jgi:rsbT antagonist protein RsbS
VSRTNDTRGERTTSVVPIIELWGQLLVPLQGEISDTQMDDLHTRILARIAERGAEGLVIDVSGVWLLDSHLCAILGRLAMAARLMGTHPVLCGLSPEVVLTLQAMGIELEGIDTALGLEDALERLGLHMEEDGAADDEAAPATHDDTRAQRSMDG